MRKKKFFYVLKFLLFFLLFTLLVEKNKKKTKLISIVASPSLHTELNLNKIKFSLMKKKNSTIIICWSNSARKKKFSKITFFFYKFFISIITYYNQVDLLFVSLINKALFIKIIDGTKREEKKRLSVLAGFEKKKKRRD